MNILNLIPTLATNQNSYKVHFAIGPEDKREPLYAFINNKFEEWQKDQSRKNFERIYILSLVYFNTNEWLFAGVFEQYGYNEVGGRYYYKTKLLQDGKELIGRLIISYEKKYRASYVLFENFSNEFILSEIFKNRISIIPFPGYENVNVDFNYLKTIIERNDKSWYSALKSVKGVYLITDATNGKHYVGSAYGDDALWQRWSEYIFNGHGENKKLKKIISENGKEYQKNFRFSILEIATKKSDDTEIIRREQYWKNILLTREFGYNDN